MNIPLLHAINYKYFPKLMRWKGFELDGEHGMFKVNGFADHNTLVDINKIFSNAPYGIPVDRTGLAQCPLNFTIDRPWQPPAVSALTLEQVFESRVNEYLKRNDRLNIFWSGGMDSTAIVVAFLLHAKNLDQLRIVYSPFSVYENQGFYQYLQAAFPQLEMIDISGAVYLDMQLDGMIINGHGGDEFTASLDETFFDSVTSEQLIGPWVDYFYNKTQNSDLIDWCQRHFACSGRSVDTLLEARWWFYASTKNHVFDVEELSFFFDQADYSINKVSAFYNCWQFEYYMWANTDSILSNPKDYKTYKKFLRHYIYKLWPNAEYVANGVKVSSRQINLYRSKKTVLQDQHWIAILTDGTRVYTDNLPLFSQREFNNRYGSSLDYLFSPIPRTLA